MRPGISTTAIWAAAAIVAVIAGTMAVVAVATDGPDRRSQDDIARELQQARTNSPPAEASPTQGPTASPQNEPTTLSTTGGVVQASCADGEAYLHSWSPQQGYRVDDVVRGPAEVASVWLESDPFDDVLIEVRCDDGTPVAKATAEDDDHDDDDDHGDDNSGRHRDDD